MAIVPSLRLPTNISDTKAIKKVMEEITTLRKELKPMTSDIPTQRRPSPYRRNQRRRSYRPSRVQPHRHRGHQDPPPRYSDEDYEENYHYYDDYYGSDGEHNTRGEC